MTIIITTNLNLFTLFSKIFFLYFYDTVSCSALLLKKKKFYIDINILEANNIFFNKLIHKQIFFLYKNLSRNMNLINLNLRDKQPKFVLCSSTILLSTYHAYWNKSRSMRTMLTELRYNLIVDAGQNAMNSWCIRWCHSSYLIQNVYLEEKTRIRKQAEIYTPYRRYLFLHLIFLIKKSLFKIL